MAGIGIWQLLIVLVIVLLLFGTKKLKNIGGDLGGAIRGFRSAMKEGGTPDEAEKEPDRLEQAAAEDDAAAQTVRKETMHEEKKSA